MIALLYWITEFTPGNMLWWQVAWWAVALFAGGIALVALGALLIGWKTFNPRERFQLFMLALFL